MNWMNREKLVFAGSGAALLLASVYGALLRPCVSEAGRHRGTLGVPGPVSIELRADMGVPGGPNPFAPFKGSSPAEQKTADQAGEQGRDRADGDRFVPTPPDPPDLVGGNRREDHRTERIVTPRPYEVPAGFRGVHRPSGGRWRVILEDKRSRKLRTFFEGDMWPSLKLRILRITSNSVLLSNHEGKRFLMRDLYGQRSRTGPGDSARAELRD